jgi:hypothetical protein
VLGKRDPVAVDGENGHRDARLGLEAHVGEAQQVKLPQDRREGGLAERGEGLLRGGLGLKGGDVAGLALEVVDQGKTVTGGGGD